VIHIGGILSEARTVFEEINPPTSDRLAKCSCKFREMECLTGIHMTANEFRPPPELTAAGGFPTATARVRYVR
jgi:hypothetical protein